MSERCYSNMVYTLDEWQSFKGSLQYAPSIVIGPNQFWY